MLLPCYVRDDYILCLCYVVSKMTIYFVFAMLCSGTTYVVLLLCDRCVLVLRCVQDDKAAKSPPGMDLVVDRGSLGQT